ncbi:phosphotransferase enzyme family protein [Fictibacillus phosphorivorans]|uniref:phosphotransferase enzyme family protein n=1 Tax=Fictibacillus phosphorivorans TaxID=1221500 RepID=UPI0012941644|nr:phosphotransferase [Fictibacillus phosphorivorans]
METGISNESLWTHLKEEVETRFGFEVDKGTPINRGWLNQKWKIETNQGVFLIKQYNKERMKRYDLSTIQSALHTQNRLFSQGIACPELLMYKGELLQKSSQGERFTVMRFMEGSLVSPVNLMSKQIQSLGEEVGKLHTLLNDGTLSAKSETLFNIPSIEERVEYWQSEIHKCDEQGLDHIRSLMDLQKTATLALDLKQFNNLTPGWCHRDLWVDNLLFSEDHLSAILDFDRMNYDFLELDIGRLIISTCMKNNTLNREAVQAFLKGYNNTNELSVERLVISLRLVWYMESTWWIDINPHDGDPPKRFQQEMVWLARHLQQLENMMNGEKRNNIHVLTK